MIISTEGQTFELIDGRLHEVKRCVTVDNEPEEGPCNNPAYADYQRAELRERCLHAALHPNFPSRSVKDVIADAKQIETYLNGGEA